LRTDRKGITTDPAGGIESALGVLGWTEELEGGRSQGGEVARETTECGAAGDGKSCAWLRRRALGGEKDCGETRERTVGAKVQKADEKAGL